MPKKMLRVQIRLLREDVESLQNAAATDGSNWQDKIRAFVRSGLGHDTPRPLYAWKFIIPSHAYVPLPDDPSATFKGCLAVATAQNENAAREILRNAAQSMGWDARWLVAGCAKVIRLDVTAPGLICFSME